MIRTDQDIADHLDPFAPWLNPPGSLPLAQSAKPSAKIPEEGLSPLGLKWRQELGLRETRSSQDSQSPLSSSISNTTLPTAVNTALPRQRDSGYIIPHIRKIIKPFSALFYKNNA